MIPRLLPLVLAWACGCGESRVDEIAAAGEAKPAPSAPPKPVPATPELDPTPLDRMLVATPTFAWSATDRAVACTATTRKGTDVTYRFELFDTSGKRLADPIDLVPGAREFATKRRPLDERLAAGFTPLTRVAWPANERELALSQTDIVLQWSERGELLLARGKGKAVVVHRLGRADMIPVAVHLGPTADFAVVEAIFDPKDKTAVDARYTECAVVPLAVGA